MSLFDPQPSLRRRRPIRAVVIGSALLAIAAASTRAFVPPVDRSESRAAYEELTQARRAYVRARVAHQQAIRRDRVSANVGDGGNDGPIRTRRGGLPDPIQLALEREVALAVANFNSVRRPLIEAVRSKPDYRQLAVARDDLRRSINALLNSGKARDDGLLNLAKHAMDLGCEMTRTEVLALALDPKVEDARLAMSETAARLQQYIDSQHVNMGRPPRTDLLAGPRPTEIELNAARERVEAANRRLVDALGREEAMEQVRAMRLAQERNGPPMSVFGY